MEPKWLYERYIAHQGYHGGAVRRNSLAAFESAITHGYNIELDVQRTRDGVPMVIHDQNLFNFTGKNANIADLTCREVQTLRHRNSDVRIPTLAEALAVCEGKTGLLIEIKKSDREDDDHAVERAVLPLLKAYRGDCCIISFNPYTVDFFRPHGITRGLLSIAQKMEDYSEVSRPLVKELLGDTEKKVDFIDMAWICLDDPFYQSIAPSIPTVVWTIASEEQYNQIKNKTKNITFERFVPSCQADNNP
jgi:glycerophosphoryl diester phosphodiesterase